MRWLGNERKCGVTVTFLKFPRRPVKLIYSLPKRPHLRTKHFAPHLNGTFDLFIFSMYFSLYFLCFDNVNFNPSYLVEFRNEVKCLYIKSWHTEFLSKISRVLHVKHLGLFEVFEGWSWLC